MYQLERKLSGVSLRDLLPNGRILGQRDIRVTSCCSDWEQVQPGDLFVAVDSSDSDGHQDAQYAVDRGAVAVLAERLLPIDVPQCLVEDSREAFSIVCHGLAGEPTRNLKVIGVTGTHGKSITCHLIHAILEAADIRTGLISTVTRFDGDSIEAGDEQGPTAPQIASSFAKMVANDFKAAVVEVSSQSLAQRHWAGMTLETAVLTNLRCEHLDYHGTEENYHAAKRRMLDQLNGDGLLVFDADDRASEQVVDTFDYPSLSISLNDAGVLNGYLIERCASEQTFLLSVGDESVAIRTKMIGDAHMRCALLAAATALSMGIDLATIARGLEKAGHIPGRLERIECGQKFSVFVDYARSPDQLADLLRSLREVTRGRVTCVFGAKSIRSREERALMGRAAERYADRAVITADDPDHEAVLEIAHDVLDGYKRPGRDHVIPDRLEAIRFAIDSSREGDTVVVVGKGDSTTQRIGGSNWVFDDRETCRDILYGNAKRELDEDSGPVIFPIDDYRDE